MQAQQTLFEKRLASYGSMSLALAAISLPSVAQANPIWNAGISTTQAMPAIYFNLTNGDFGTIPETGSFELLMDVRSLATKARLIANNPNQFAVSASSVARLPVGASVGPSLTFAQAFSTLAANSVNHFGHWNLNAAPGETGLSIVLNGNTYYGWANIVVDPVTYAIRLNSFGRGESPGQTLTVTPTPESASIVLLCLGAAGIAAYRRKKQENSQMVSD